MLLWYLHQDRAASFSRLSSTPSRPSILTWASSQFRSFLRPWISNSSSHPWATTCKTPCGRLRISSRTPSCLPACRTRIWWLINTHSSSHTVRTWWCPMVSRQATHLWVRCSNSNSNNSHTISILTAWGCSSSSHLRWWTLWCNSSNTFNSNSNNSSRGRVSQQTPTTLRLSSSSGEI